MRKLVLIRIVHSPTDMGSVSEGLEKESIAKVGKERWVENLKRIEKFWEEAESEIDTLGLDYQTLQFHPQGDIHSTRQPISTQGECLK